MVRAERLNERFNQWRKQNASKEQGWMLTAIAISDYVDSIESLDTIKTDIGNSNSPKYIQFDQNSARSMGALLYVKLVIDEYLANLPEAIVEERQLLNSLSDILAEMYVNGKKDISSLIVKAKLWLDTHANTTPDKKQAKALCYALYTMLKIINISFSTLDNIDNLDWATRLSVRATVATLKAAGIDLVQLKREITTLLQKTEEIVQQLCMVHEDTLDFFQNSTAVENCFVDTVLESSCTGGYTAVLRSVSPRTSLIAASCERSLLATPKTIHEHFNDKFISVLESNDPEAAKLETLNEIAKTESEAITALLVEGAKKTEITSKIEKVKKLLRAVEENEQLVVGRKYFLDLIKECREQFDVLMENVQGPEKDQLIAKKKQLENPEVIRSIYSGGQYLLSWGTAGFTAVYRSLASSELQGTVATYFPTVDSECKIELKALAKSCLMTLESELVPINRKIEELNAQLANGNEELMQFLGNASADTLKDLQKASTTVRSVVVAYCEAFKPIKKLGEKLEAVKKLDDDLDKFIRKHNGWLVKLSNFFAQLCSIFKTDTASMIDAARQYKTNLRIFREKHEQLVSKEIEKFKEKPNVPVIIKAKLSQLLSQPLESRPEIASETLPGRSAKEEYQLILVGLHKQGLFRHGSGAQKSVEVEDLKVAISR